MPYSKGVCIWFTGRSGTGKSTITAALTPLLDECGHTFTILDVVPLLAKSWCVRTSKGKLLRKGFVAREVVRHSGVAICVTISARRETREAVRQLVGADSFVEVFVDVPPEVAAARKAGRKQKARPLLKRVRIFKRYFSVGEASAQSPETPLGYPGGTRSRRWRLASFSPRAAAK